MRLIKVLLCVSAVAGVCECIVDRGLEFDHEPLAVSYFHCDEDRDLDLAWQCDGTVDCADKTDERDCDYDDCKPDDTDRFFCRDNRKCILKDFVCDGKYDCRDRSDELNCTKTPACPSEFFACTDGSNCIPKSFMCDGHPECLDKSDESKETCHGTLHGYGICKGRFKCGHGLCLADDKFICDGKKHCPDGRDEAPETCEAHPDCKKCSQTCKRHAHGATCGCNPGFELSKDEATCVDIDECARGLCSQNCLNTEGSFKCNCRPGFNKINETRCENKINATFVWYRGDNARGKFIILHREGSKDVKFKIPNTGSEEHLTPALMPPLSFDIDNGKLYARIANTLYSMNIPSRRNPRPALIPVLSPHVQMSDFAVDYATGNIYFVTMKGTGINVCDVGGACMPYVSRRSDIVSRIQIAQLASGTKLFWREGKTVMSGSLDGSDYHQVFRVLSGEALRYFVVDEQSEKMYVALTNLLEVDLKTSKTRLLTKLDFGSQHFFWNMAVHDDVVLIQAVDARSVADHRSRGIINKIIKIDRLTGDHLGPLDVPAHTQLHSIRRASKTPLQNPCINNRCSHICAPVSSPSTRYACLCPPGMRLEDNDDKTCIPQEGEEVVFFVNGTSVSTYVYEDGELYLNTNFNLNESPLAIATSLDMNLIVSTHQRIYEVKSNGAKKVYRVRAARAMAVDPVDDVLYAANEFELLAVNLRTSAVALIRNSVDIKHMDIDPLNRILYVESTDSKLYSMEIGSWEPTELEKVPTPSNDGQRTWAYDAAERIIQTTASLVLERGYCDLIHEPTVGFTCHTRGWLLERCAHDDHEIRLLARAGRPLVATKGTACGTQACEFCVSANGNTTLEPVCVCPYGHEMGADGVSCSKSCGLQMLRCSGGDGKCVHQSTRCDGVNDCPDGSDEKNCNEHDCQDNFKCLSDGTCVSKRFVCDGNRDCSDGSDEANCQARNCTAVQFKCEDGECLSMAKRCNGVVDCYHGDDEKDCPKVACKKHEFDCGNNFCISQEWICDSQKDCPNGEDEADCSSSKSKLRKLPEHNCDSKWIFCCRSGEQLPVSMQCDGIPQCFDRSDEENCNVTCTTSQFQCNNGACLDESEVCDGIAHCPNRADEHNCKGKCWKKDLYECVTDGTCLHRSKVCDGNNDCSDGADEHHDLCIFGPPPKNTTAACGSDEFKCRDGQCVPLYHVCDDRKQCKDGSDEGDFCKKLDCKAAGCSQSCFAEDLRRVTCMCHKGYRLARDGYACEDIDECAETPEVCPQFCENLKGSFKCSCAAGFVMNARGECRVEHGDPLYLLTENGVVEAVHKNHDRSLVLNRHGFHIGDVEYDVTNGLVFVSDTDNDQIHRIPLNMGRTKYKHEAFSQLKPGALALDWITGNLYFADHRPSIHVCDRNLTSGNCRILTQVNIKPVPGHIPPAITSIALVPDEGIMFYAEASTGFIFRQNMDGTDKSAFAWSAGEKRPLSLTVDYIHRNLYWIDAHSGSIESSNLKGERIRRITTGLSSVRTFALFEDYLLYPDPERDSWITIHKQTGNIRSTKHAPMGSVSHIRIMHAVNQPHEVNRCPINRCQQLCLMRPHGFACACADGQELTKDNKTCVQVTIDDNNLYDEKWQARIKAACSCENGGKCHESRLMKDSYYCKCPSGFHGKRCESGPTKSMVLTVLLITLISFVIGFFGLYGILLVARRDRRRRAAQLPEGCDRLTLIEKESEEET